MRFGAPLIPGRLIRRYKRFLADVDLESGETVTAHCANSGSMLSVNEPGARVWLSPATNPARKLRYTWEMIEIGPGLVGINTSRPNALVAEAITMGAVPELAGYDSLRREVRYGRNSRIDLLLEAAGRPPCYVEIKNVTMKRGAAPSAPAEFPDAVTARGTKHLEELAAMAATGARAVIFFLVQRTDCTRMSLAADIDPAYAAAYLKAHAAGVETLVYGCTLSPEEIRLAQSIPLALPAPAR